MPSIAKLFRELVRVLPHSTAVGPPPHRVGAGCTPEPRVPRGSLSPGRAPVPRAVLGGQHRLVWPCRGGCPRVSPLGCAAGALPPALAALLPWRLRALLLGS